MLFTNEYAKDNLLLDTDADIGFDGGLNYGVCITSYETVTLALYETGDLNRIADTIRCALGYKAIEPRTELACEYYDEEGWYDFYAEVSTIPHGENVKWSRVELYFIVCDSQSEDNGALYNIYLNQEEQKNIYERLNELTKKHHKKSLEELFDEAAMEVDETEVEAFAALPYGRDIEGE